MICSIGITRYRIVSEIVGPDFCLISFDLIRFFGRERDSPILLIFVMLERIESMEENSTRFLGHTPKNYLGAIHLMNKSKTSMFIVFVKYEKKSSLISISFHLMPTEMKGTENAVIRRKRTHSNKEQMRKRNGNNAVSFRPFITNIPVYFPQYP